MGDKIVRYDDLEGVGLCSCVNPDTGSASAPCACTVLDRLGFVGFGFAGMGEAQATDVLMSRYPTLFSMASFLLILNVLCKLVVWERLNLGWGLVPREWKRRKPRMS